MAEEGSGKLGWIIGALVAVPLLIGTCSTLAFCGVVGVGLRGSKPSTLPATVGCAPGSPCASLTFALESAGRADSDGLRAALADPSWIDRLPQAATTTSDEKGQLWLRALLGIPPASLEELRGKPLQWRLGTVATALDGRTATVQVELRDLPGQAEITTASVGLVRSGESWKLAPR